MENINNDQCSINLYKTFNFVIRSLESDSIKLSRSTKSIKRID